MGKPASDLNDALRWTPSPQLRGEAAHIRHKFSDDPVKMASMLRGYLKNLRNDPNPSKELSFQEIIRSKPIPKPSQEAFADAMKTAADD